MSDLDLFVPSPDRPGDASSVVGSVLAVDAAARLVQVLVHGSPLWLPALPGRYRVADLDVPDVGLARVSLHARSGRPEQVLAPVDPNAPATLATVVSTSGSTMTVSWLGSNVALPAIPSTYTTGQTAWVALDDWGDPVLVQGPSTLAAPAPPPAPPPAPGPSLVTVETTITPQWSGTFRHSRGAWDRWNATRGDLGGRSTLYQGDGYGSGAVTGLATYGSLFTNLGATSIVSAVVSVQRVNTGTGSGAATVQGSPHGSRPGGAPSHSGSTASSGGMGVGGSSSISLPSAIREGLRTGTYRGLALVGGHYMGVRGTPSGMSVRVRYTRPA